MCRDVRTEPRCVRSAEPTLDRGRAGRGIAIIESIEVRRRRPRTRWTPTDALSNTVSWREDEPGARGWVRWDGRVKARPGSRFRAGGLSTRPRPTSRRTYDIVGKRTTR